MRRMLRVENPTRDWRDRTKVKIIHNYWINKKQTNLRNGGTDQSAEIGAEVNQSLGAHLVSGTLGFVRDALKEEPG
jgi:hypothetical protein